MKRIAFVLPQYLPVNLPGSGTFIVSLAQRLARDGNDVTVITSDSRVARSWYAPVFGKSIEIKNENINGVHVIRLSVNWFLSSACYVLARIGMSFLPKKFKEKVDLLSWGPNLIGLKRILRNGRFDVVHSSPFPFYLNYQVAQALRALPYRPYFVTTPFFHGKFKEFKNTYLANVLGRADVIHVISDSETKDMKNNLRIDGQKIVKIPLSVDLTLFKSRTTVQKKIQTLLYKYNLQNRIIIMFAGNKGKWKGTIDLLQAVKQLYEENNRYMLVAIGSSMPEWTTELKKNYGNIVLDLPYQHGIDKEAWFSLAKVFAMPSIGESFGLVYLEAWHKKKAVIGADIPPVKELIIKNRGGLIVRYHDVNGLKNAIRKLVTNRGLSLTLGTNGYKALLKNYSFEKNYKLYKGIFK